MTLGSFWACLGLITAFFLLFLPVEEAMSVLYLTALYPEAHDCGLPPPLRNSVSGWNRTSSLIYI